MRKFLVGIITCVLTLFALAPQTFAQSFINQADIDAIEKAQGELEAFSNALSNSQTSEADFQAQASKTVAALEALMARNFHLEAIPTYAAAGNTIKEAANKLRTDVMEAHGILKSGDRAAGEAFTTRYNANIAGLNRAVTDFNATVQAGNQANQDKRNKEDRMTLVPVIVSFVFNLALFLWSKTKKKIDSRLRRARKNLVASSLGLTVGFAVAALSYNTDTFRGSYFAWLPAVIGIYLFLRTILDYLSVRKSLRTTQSQVN